MMNTHRIVDDASGKFDALLLELYSSNKLQEDNAISVLIRCRKDSLEKAIARVESLAGRIQRTIATFQLIAAWIPANRLLTLAEDSNILEIAYEQEYVVA